jgi:hypothetical protein
MLALLSSPWGLSSTSSQPGSGAVVSAEQRLATMNRSR